MGRVQRKHHILSKTKQQGFTIVELLIVVVIISILAAVVVVAYNGITSQARNAKTLSAADTWAKALRLYKVENGGFPTQQSCLGSATTYSGDGYCWDGTYWNVKPNFLTMMDDYISSFPEPDTTEISSTYTQRRGAFYYMPSGAHVIRIMLAGESSCPSSSIGPLHSQGLDSAGIWCQYSLD